MKKKKAEGRKSRDTVPLSKKKSRYRKLSNKYIQRKQSDSIFNFP
jgi:hypothetical protein